MDVREQMPGETTGPGAERHSPEAGAEPAAGGLGALQARVAELERELARALAERETGRALLARASHEIRNPANAIWGLACGLLESGLEAGDQECAQAIASAAGTLLALTRELLDHGALESGRLQFASAPFAPRECLEESLQVVAFGARARNLDLEGRVAPEVPDLLVGDGLRLRQVLINLLQNAVKFTAFGAVSAAVMVEAREARRVRLRLEVTDTGMGLSSQARERLFNPYDRPGESLGIEGSGLGLSICRELVQLQGGEIGVDSRPRKGSRFWVTLPFDLPAEAAEGVPGPLQDRRLAVLEPRELARLATCEALERAGARVCGFASPAEFARCAAAGAQPELVVWGLGEKELALESFRQALPALAAHCPLILLSPRPPPSPGGAAQPREAPVLLKPVREQALVRACLERLGAGVPAPAPAPRTELAALGWRVLLVEDDAVNQLHMGRLLASRGATVRIARSGEEALALLETEGEFDLVVTDAHLPGMDGAQTTRRLRAHPSCARTPVLALTADAAPDTHERMRRAGAADCLLKPVEPEAFWSAACALVGGPRGKATPAIDRRAGLERAGGNAAAARELLGAFAAGLPGELDRLERALNRGELNEVAQAAHAMAGGAIYCAAPTVLALAEALQEHARAGEARALPGLLEQLRAAVAAVIAAASQSGS